jgi:hypothetical protein
VLASAVTDPKEIAGLAAMVQVGTATATDTMQVSAAAHLPSSQGTPHGA